MRDFHLPGRSAGLRRANGLCATSHPLAGRADRRSTPSSRGGNAADAAVASAVLIGLCEPAMTGLGGDAFVMLKPAGEERMIGLNGSGRSPAALSRRRICASRA
jgi:gamma-glutamyltranspeptidase/glutathione hydrolase